jgi:CDP-diacylglycerol---serine O-phosphatidyltransferase
MAHEPQDSHLTDAPESSDAKHRAPYYWLPNALTTGALWAGFYAIVAAIDHNFSRAGIAIFVAMVFDGLDGRVARWTNTQSEFGKEYDSLSDMVSFGVAPAIVAYQFGVARIADYNAVWGKLGWLATFLYAACAAMRLARFNSRTATADKRFFEGLPSPSAAAAVAGFIWLASEYELSGLPALVLAFVVTTVIGLLMVSSFAYWSGKELNLRGRVRWAYLLVIPVAYILISAGPGEALFVMFAVYALHAPVLWAWRKVFHRRIAVKRTPSHDQSGHD